MGRQEGNQEDQVEKFLIFKAYSNTHYLSLQFTTEEEFKDKEDGKISVSKLDPFQEVQKLIQEAKENTEDFRGSSEMKNNYLEIQKDLEHYLVEILDQCETMKDVQ